MKTPLISINIDNRSTAHWPGQSLHGEYQIDAVDVAELRAVEMAVLWYTEGKGDEDLGVHYFERRTPEDAVSAALNEFRPFHVVLPNSPLSYEGVLIKIRWCVRVRAFVRSGKTYSYELGFQMGEVPAGRAVLKADDKADSLAGAVIETAKDVGSIAAKPPGPTRSGTNGNASTQRDL